jgi:hypothetical protein
MQGTIEKQIELRLQVATQPRHNRTPQQEAWFQAKLAEISQEREELRAFFLKLDPDLDFENISKLPLERYKWFFHKWHESRGHFKTCAINPRPNCRVHERPIRQWSTLAKQRKRLAQLHKRMYRKYSFPEYFHQAIQEQLLTNPDYYGVCPLPSELACKYYPPNLRRMAAIEEENNRRLGGK